LDEISLHRGHGQYVLVISAPELGLVLDVLPNRDKETLEKWLDERGKDWCAAVEVACSDMWDAYQNVAAVKLPNARCTVDRFHVMKNLNDALTKARRSIQKDADENTKNILKGCRWPLVKTKENLKAEDKQKLDEVFTVSQELAVCDGFKEAFRDLFNQQLDFKSAEERLLAWVTQVEACKYKALKAFAKTLRN